MTRRTIRRFAVAALAALIFSVAAAPAQARGLGPAPDVSQWLQNLWIEGFSALWTRNGPPATAPAGSRETRKAGAATDPNGSPGTAAPAQKAGHATDPNGSPGTAAPACGACGNAGHTVDPDG